MNALDYLVKPINFEDLQQAIHKCIAKLGQKKNSERIKATLSNLEELILNILPKEIAKEIKENGSAKPQHYDLVTVLFADIKGFSQHAERLNPEELLEELNYYYSAFDLIMEEHGVEKIKTIGDAYMAAAGVPVQNKTNPKDAINAALAMLDFIEETATFRIEQGKQPFEFRIGLHSGPVVAGIVGLKKFAYDIWGDTVNIAARMEENGTVGKINISQSTYDLTKETSEFSFTSRGKIQAKGKGLLEMFYVEK
jgi:adenylate cyclase